ncbi:MAG: DegV family protein [Dehalococcoidia bacterium]|nr:MAG: DegV family protein [Dehalococcoidia bacterium]
MIVKVVTDSTADLPGDVVRELGITVIPLLIHIDDETFEDGVTISPDGFYNLLATGDVLPKTSAPSSGMFIEAYERLAQETDAIVSIHISAKLSAAYAAALVARDGIDAPCRIEILDSLSTSMGLGLLVVQAATMARDGANLEDIVRVTEASIPRTQFFGVLDTLEYLHKGGRIGKAASFLGAMLKLKPILCLHDGIVHPVERVRGREQALDRLCEMVVSYGSASRLAIAYTTNEAEMEQFASRLSQFFPSGEMLRSRCGATIGSYLGPGALGVALIQAPVDTALTAAEFR